MILLSPDISLIVTVFNKEKYLPSTLASLFWQQPTKQNNKLSIEYIFVDDMSSDNSLKILEHATKKMPNVRIVRNTFNAGPSIRLNQGARLARGHFLQFFDSDDIMPLGTTTFLHRLLTDYNADLIYGRWKKTGELGEELLKRQICVDLNAEVNVSNEPLKRVLNDSFSRMTFMVRTDVFSKANGADERIFIQDESLPLRLASLAKRMLTVSAHVLLVPRQEETLSSNKSQLNHDRFLANFFMLRDAMEIDEYERRLLFRRCVSAVWKEVRKNRRILAVFTWICWYYLYSSIYLISINFILLNWFEEYMAKIEGVRRVL